MPRDGEIDEEIMKLLLSGPQRWTQAQVLDILNGDPPEDEAERERISALAEALEGASVEVWPAFDVVWDLDPTNHHKTLDGCRPKDFRRGHPDGLVTVWTTFADLDARLSKFNHRTAEEIWRVGDPRKAARAIVHWGERRKMTPAMIDVASNGDIALVGGNHRLAVARAKRVKEIPLLVDPNRLDAVRAKLPLIDAPELT